jgi:surface antigen
MVRSRNLKQGAAALAAALAFSSIALTAAEADPWHGGHGWYGGPRGPVVVVRPGYYYAPPPPVYYYPPPPPVYYAPPPVVYGAPPPVVYQPAPVVVAAPPPPQVVCRDSGTGAALGAAAGGTAGAILGATSGHGHHQWAATAGGAILGVLLGGTVGHAVDTLDQDCAAEAVAYGPVGQPVGWASPSYGTEYQVTPVRQYAAQGTTCREYVANAAVNGRWQQVRGTACVQPDGSWRVVN